MEKIYKVQLRNGTSRIDFYLNILFQPSKQSSIDSTSNSITSRFFSNLFFFPLRTLKQRTDKQKQQIFRFLKKDLSFHMAINLQRFQSKVGPRGPRYHNFSQSAVTGLEERDERQSVSFPKLPMGFLKKKVTQ